jgi:glycosyltransferase involved in cell wall biosynthesis
MRSLVMMHVPANTGYAIAPLERLFYSILLKLSSADQQAVHFAYTPPLNAHPDTLPPNTPVLVFDRRDKSAQNIDKLTQYVALNQIKFVLIFDGQPTSALYGALRRAGVQRLIAYWGAEISPPNSGLRLLMKRIEVMLSKSKLDGLVFESRAMARLATHGRGVPERLIDVVPLGIDTSQFHPEANDHVYSVFGIPRNRKVVVYAGHMEERKGVRTIIESAIELLKHRQRRDVHFLFLGNKTGESATYEEMYATLGIDEFITFGGYRKDLSSLFPGCFVGVIASSGWDSFPRTSLELAACGLPLIVTDLGGLPETVVDNVTGYVIPPRDAHALADKIEALLENASIAHRMGKASRARCEAEYSLAVQFRRLEGVVRRRLLGDSLR